MDQQWIEKLRSPRFTEKLRGYDREEVTAFLSELADWFEAGGDGAARTRKGTVEHDAVERVTENLSGVLRAAHEAAEKLRGDADRDAATARREADEHAERVRLEADEHAERVRAEAEQEAKRARDEAESYARELRADAERESERTRSVVEQQQREAGEAAAAEAESILEAAQAEKAEVEAVIGELVERRDAVIADLQRLTGEIRSVVGSAESDPLGTAKTIITEAEPAGDESTEVDQPLLEEEEMIDEYEVQEAADEVRGAEAEEDGEEDEERGDTAERPRLPAPFDAEDEGINPAL